METPAPEEYRRRPKTVLPGGIGMILSSAVHAAAVPLLAFSLGAAKPEIIEPPTVEVTLAWAAPAPEQPDPPPHPEAAPAAVTPPFPYPPPRPPAVHRPASTKPSARPSSPEAPVASTPAPAVPSSEAALASASAVPSNAPPPPAEAPLPPPDKAEILARYSKLLLEQLERHKTYPALSLRRGEEGTIMLRLTLAADGSLVAVQASDEGPSRLVEASLTAVRETGRFPPPPPGLGSGQVVFNIPITYRIR